MLKEEGTMKANDEPARHRSRLLHACSGAAPPVSEYRVHLSLAAEAFSRPEYCRSNWPMTTNVWQDQGVELRLPGGILHLLDQGQFARVPSIVRSGASSGQNRTQTLA